MSGASTYKLVNMADPTSPQDYATKNYVDSSIIPTGAVLSYAGSSAPSGYLLCYGQAVSRTTYAALFAAIGTTYGDGDGSTTFNIPDYRGRVGAGKDDMGGVSANRLTDQSGGVNGDVLGDTGGSETHSLTSAQNAPHTHSISYEGSDSTNVNILGSVLRGGSTQYTAQTGSSGSGQAHNNVQPTIIENKIIKT